jgi:hypothetical protein
MMTSGAPEFHIKPLAGLWPAERGRPHVRVPGGELGVQLPREPDQRQRSRLELAGVGGAFAGALPRGSRAVSAEPALYLGLVRAAPNGAVERSGELRRANALHHDVL